MDFLIADPEHVSHTYQTLQVPLFYFPIEKKIEGFNTFQLLKKISFLLALSQM